MLASFFITGLDINETGQLQKKWNVSNNLVFSPFFLHYMSYSPIIPSMSKCSSHHFIFHRKCMFWVICFYPNHRFFSHFIKPLYSQPTYSSWWLGVFFFCLFRALQLIASPDVNKNKGMAEQRNHLPNTVPTHKTHSKHSALSKLYI